MLVRGQQDCPLPGEVRGLTALRVVRPFAISDEACCLCSRSAPQLREDVAHVNADCLFGDPEHLSDLAIRAPMRDFTQHRFLSCRQHTLPFCRFGRCRNPGFRSHAGPAQYSPDDVALPRQQWTPELIEQLPSERESFAELTGRE